MMSDAKHMVIALSLSAGFIVFNIYAVTTGMADGYYAQVTEWLKPVLKG